MSYPNIPGLNLSIHTIFCIGRNYARHAAEMNSEVLSEPMVFLKPATVICYDGDTIQLPRQSKDVHHEVEMVIAIGKNGKNIPESEAANYIAGVGVGIDFTARDLQSEAKKNGHPWSLCKGFDTFGPISNLVSAKKLNLSDLDLSLSVNGEMRQQGNTSDMIFDATALISYLSSVFTLMEGDLIFTGTPEGVSAVQSGDTVKAVLGNDTASLTVVIE